MKYKRLHIKNVNLDAPLDTSVDKLEGLLKKVTPKNEKIDWNVDEATKKWLRDNEVREETWSDIWVFLSRDTEKITHDLINTAVTIIAGEQVAGVSFVANLALKAILKKNADPVEADTIRISLDAAAKAESDDVLFYALRPLETIFGNIFDEQRRTLFSRP
jgi:hypothetical protein